jgi:5-methylcytosine-specific restriction enzyme A
MGIDVSNWKSSADPKYCYEYSYQTPKFSVISMNFSALKQDGGAIYWEFNKFSFLEDRPSKVEERRARDLVRAVERAAYESLPVRLIVFESANKRVRFRTLDPKSWAVVRRNTITGDYVLQRGVLPVELEPDAEAEAHGFKEGERRLWYRYHRKREARLRAEKIKDALAKNQGRLLCEVPGCGFNFVTRYGGIGEGFAHVHHKAPLSDSPDEGRTVSVNELAIVCPNCHAMIHVGGECRPLEALIAEPLGSDEQSNAL